MTNPIPNTLPALACFGMLAIAGLLSGLSPRASSQPQSPPAVEIIEGEVRQAGEATTRKHRRVRASLSMPYFSFAQSLRPRG